MLTADRVDDKHCKHAKSESCANQQYLTFRDQYGEGATEGRTSYFAFIGDETGFGDSPGEGNAIRSFIDGTSNTIMVVETQKEVPWSKPEDITYADSNDLPELGGWFDNGFIVGLADGSARFVADSVDETTMRNLIKRNDRNPVQF